MKNYQKTLLALAVSLTLGVGQAFAGNITIGDPNTTGEQTSGWYKGGSTPTSEYQEVEPNMQTGAVWDLAAFVADQTNGKLGVLSGYNLKNGYSGTTIGDIFVSANPPVPLTYSDGFNYPHFEKNGTMTPGFNWDFAIRMDFTALKYKVYKLDSNTWLENGEYWDNPNNYNASSQPWRVALTNPYPTQTGNIGTLIGTYDMTYTAGMTPAAALPLVGYTPTTEYKYYVELQQMGWLAPFQQSQTNAQDYFHLTMYCGNDDLWGYTSSGYKLVPDGAATILLLGLGVLSMSAFYWKKSS